MKSRKCNLMSAGDHDFPILKIEETEGNRISTTYYRVESIPSQFGGRGFQLFKDVNPEEAPVVYSVLVHGEHSLCDCPGQEFLASRGRAKQCKHIVSLSTLIARGRIK